MSNGLLSRPAAEFVVLLSVDPPVVEYVDADEFGGFRLLLSASYSLVVFPATSFPVEHWRYFRYGCDDSHFVVFEDAASD
ncbi:hypothetical protein AB3662_24650 [Sorangium cellulosum]|uniref:hypothetical protein n=1 Tax=Sorangium cellulosum TaxID=56 RepID=UPI003D9A36FA